MIHSYTNNTSSNCNNQPPKNVNFNVTTKMSIFNILAYRFPQCPAPVGPQTWHSMWIMHLQYRTYIWIMCTASRWWVVGPNNACELAKRLRANPANARSDTIPGGVFLALCKSCIYIIHFRHEGLRGRACQNVSTCSHVWQFILMHVLH